MAVKGGHAGTKKRPQLGPRNKRKVSQMPGEGPTVTPSSSSTALVAVSVVKTLAPRAGLYNTVGTKILADPEKCFQELVSKELLIFITGWALFGINYRFQ